MTCETAACTLNPITIVQLYAKWKRLKENRQLVKRFKDSKVK